MKKRVSSSFRPKAPRPKRDLSRAGKVTRRHSKPRVLSATTRIRATSSTARSTVVTITPATADILSPLAVQPLGLSHDIIQTDSVEEPFLSPLNAELIKSGVPASLSDPRRRRAAMWIGVSVSMLIIVTGWVWALRYSLAIPATSSNTLPIQEAQDDLTVLFEKVTRALDELKTSSVQQRFETSTPALPLIQNLTPEQIELLKQKINEISESADAPEKTP